MVKKQRGVRDGDGNGDSSDRRGILHKRCQPDKDSRTVFGGISLEEIVSQLQPWFRETVRKEVNRALCLSREPYVSLAENSQGCNLELRFTSEVAHTQYSGIPVEADGGIPLRIMLVDRATRETVINGPLSSLKVEIVVISSEFSSDDEREDWTTEDFNRSIVREREGKRPLLTGEISTTLKGGVGNIGIVTFTDNSSWTRRKKFRLGARVVRRMPTEARIREAVSNPFSVKDHRGERYKKHYPPFLHDEVWRLEQIRKDGPLHRRLRSHGIDTVVDFLRRYEVDPPTLKSILGAGTHQRTWNAIVDHANTCVVDDGTFWACHFASENVILKLNSVYSVVAAACADFGNLNYVPLENLTLRQKAIVESLKPEAHERRSEWLLVDAGADWTPNLLQNELSIGQQGVVQEPILSPPETIHSMGALDVGEVSQLFLEAFGCDTEATTAEYVIQGVGDEDCFEWLPCSSSCSTWAEGQPPLVIGMGMNSNRSSLTSLNTLASSSHKEYQQKEEDPQRL